MSQYDQAPKLTGVTAPSGPAWIGVLVMLSLVAIVAGAGLGLLLSSMANNATRLVSASKGAVPDGKYGGQTSLRDLPPIIANLAEPSDAWIRLRASIVLDAAVLGKPDLVVAEIGEDILGYLRTLSLTQISGASGLQHLREDLNERASVRSNGQIRELIIQTLVVQ